MGGEIHCRPKSMPMKKMLIVEDNEDMRNYLKLVASRFGYQVVLADSPAEAGKALGRDAFDFAVVSTSAYAGDFDRGLRDVVGGVGGANVVVICGDRFSEVARLADAQGVRACLTTPFELVFVTDILDERQAASLAEADGPEGARKGGLEP